MICQGGTAFLALRSNPRFFFWLYRNFFLFFTIFLQFLFYYGILPCFTQNNTVIISIFLQPFPVIYKFYGKNAFCKKLFTVILFEWLPPRRQLCSWDLFFLKTKRKNPLTPTKIHDMIAKVQKAELSTLTLPQLRAQWSNQFFHTFEWRISVDSWL